jgi:hypothetical protein
VDEIAFEVEQMRTFRPTDGSPNRQNIGAGVVELHESLKNPFDEVDGPLIPDAWVSE